MGDRVPSRFVHTYVYDATPNAMVRSKRVLIQRSVQEPLQVYRQRTRFRIRAGGPGKRGGCPTHSRFLCRVPGHGLQSVPTHPLHFLLTGNPALDYGRALDSQVDLADQGGAVIHLQALF